MNQVVRASIPVQLSPSQAEIVFVPETQGYALSFGITVTLPVTELVETLLKFNTQNTSGVATDNVVGERSFVTDEFSEAAQIASSSIDQENGTFNVPNSSLKLDAVNGGSSSLPVEYDFSDIPISLIRADSVYQEYVQRGKWQYSESSFLVRDSQRRVEDSRRRSAAQAENLALARKIRSASTASTEAGWGGWGGRQQKLSADAPVFLPGGLGAETVEPSTWRGRSYSEAGNGATGTEFVSGSRSRAMTAAAPGNFSPPVSFWSPPAVEEENENGCKQM